MKILVSVKRVIDYHIKVHIQSDRSGIDLSGVQMSMNPFDEIAVEEAVRLKEKGIAQEIYAVSIGPKACQETLRAALALGVDRALLIETQKELHPLGVAKALKKVVEKVQPDLVLMGKQAIDDDCNQTGQMLAALLGWPQATFVSMIAFDQGSLIVNREIDRGVETLRVSLPAVITTDLRLNEPRYATLPNIIKAKQKPLEVFSEEDFGIKVSPHLKCISMDEPPKRKSGVKVSSVDELIDKLQKEAKVI